MRKHLCPAIALAGVLAFFSCQAIAAEETVLAVDGTARMPIVVAQGATERQQELAAELAALLKEISGADFAVTTGDGSAGLVLGTLEQFAQPDWDEALTIEGHDGLEAYGVRSDSDRLLILGATELGLDRGITRFLEALGCRWFFPSEAWQIIPRLDRVAVDLDLTDRPALLSRVIWWGWGAWDARAQEDHVQWMRRNWMGESLKVYCSHAWQTIIDERRDAFEAHPEYLALVKTTDPETGEVTAERGGHKFCISNPDLVELCRQWALDYFEKNPDADMVSMEPSDGGGHCECDACLAMGPIPERVHYLVNEVAKAVRAKYPGKYVGTYAYNLHSKPPSFRMEPNVYVQITAGFTRGRYTFFELIDEWAKHVDQIGIYEYLNVWAWTRDMPARPRGADLGYLQKHIPYYAARKATTMSCESGSNYGVNGLGYLVASRLMWDPEADVEAVCEDFYQKAFGPGAEPMRRYYERFDPGSKPLMSEHLLALAHRDLAEASRLASDRPDVLARLDEVKLYLYYVRLMRDLDMSEVGEARLEALLPVLNLAYRTRHRYIVNSPAVRGRYQEFYLRNLEAPEAWDYTKMGDQTAWYTGDDYTSDEVEGLFQQGLERFAVQDFTEVTFSSDLALLGSDTQPGAPAARLCFQGPEPFTMQSLGGEPLEFRLMTGVIAHYRDFRPTQWRVLDAGQKEIASGELPLDGEWHPLSVAVPAAGTYHFRIDDFGAGWQIDYAPGKPFAWVLEKGKVAYSMGTMVALYFHVPPGTQEVAYHVEGSAHSLVDAKGQTIAEVPRQAGNVIVVPVPEGSDGQVWSIRNLSRTQLWLYNCPNYLAAHPEDLLVPRELLGQVAP